MSLLSLWNTNTGPDTSFFILCTMFLKYFPCNSLCKYQRTDLLIECIFFSLSKKRPVTPSGVRSSLNKQCREWEIQNHNNWRVEGRLNREGIYIYIYLHTHTQSYGWFMLLYSRNQHNFVKQLSSNYKKRIGQPVSTVAPWLPLLSKLSPSFYHCHFVVTYVVMQNTRQMWESVILHLQ